MRPRQRRPRRRWQQSSRARRRRRRRPRGRRATRRRSKSFAKTSRTTRPSSRRSLGTRRTRSTKTRISWTCRSGTRRLAASELDWRDGSLCYSTSAHQATYDLGLGVQPSAVSCAVAGSPWNGEAPLWTDAVQWGFHNSRFVSMHFLRSFFCFVSFQESPRYFSVRYRIISKEDSLLVLLLRLCSPLCVRRMGRGVDKVIGRDQTERTKRLVSFLAHFQHTYIHNHT